MSSMASGGTAGNGAPMPAPEAAPDLSHAEAMDAFFTRKRSPSGSASAEAQHTHFDLEQHQGQVDSAEPSVPTSPARKKYRMTEAQEGSVDEGVAEAGPSEPAKASKGKAKSSKKKGSKEDAERRRREKAAAAAALAEDDALKAQAQAEAEAQELVEGEKVYCVCRTMYGERRTTSKAKDKGELSHDETYADDERMMIACDRCDDWYHTSCMKMKDEQVELVDMFICPKCEPFTPNRTTWKPKCLRAGCTHASVPPLSRYCSERCGILTAASRIAKTKHFKGGPNPASGAAAQKLLGSVVKGAKRREGLCIWSEAGADEQQGGASVGHALEPARWFKIVESMQQRGDGGDKAAATEQPDSELIKALPRDTEEQTSLEARLEELCARRLAVSASLDVLAARVKLLQLAEDRMTTLPTIGLGDDAEAKAAAAAKKSSSKKKKGAKGSGGTDEGGGKMQPRCGYDERLGWSDARFERWAAGERGRAVLDESEPLDGVLVGPDGSRQTLNGGDADADEEDKDAAIVCGTAKRKCKRHADWSVIRNADFDVERELLTNALSTLSETESQARQRLKALRSESEATRAAAKAAAAAKDAALAMTLSREGPRRMALLAK